MPGVVGGSGQKQPALTQSDTRKTHSPPDKPIDHDHVHPEHPGVAVVVVDVDGMSVDVVAVGISHPPSAVP